MTNSTYWSRMGERRISRRRALRGAAIGGAGLAGAALIGCGGDDDDDGTPAPGGTTAPGATTAPGETGTAAPAETVDPMQPVSGGVLNLITTGDVDTWDSIRAANAKTTTITGYMESRLVEFDVGDGGPAPGSISPDAAESFEFTDALTLVFKLRDNVLFDQRAPTNGRAVTAEDWVLSFEKFEAEGQYRSGLSNTVNDKAPIKSLEAIDDRTLKMNLAFADVSLLASIGNTLTGLWLQPMEGIRGDYDTNADVRGTGPFFLAEHKPAVGFKYARNPKWHLGPDLPYVDELDVAILGDGAQSEAQFKAGNLDYGGVAVVNVGLVLGEVDTAEPILAAPSARGRAISFSYREGHAWTDVRLRRAMSMAFDREAFLDVTFDPETLQAAGIATNTYWNNPMSAGWGGYWLDPQDEATFGPAAKFLQHNVAEAAKLTAAMGYTEDNPFETTLILTPQYFPDIDTRSAFLQASVRPIGVDVKIHASDYTTEWIPEYLRAHGDYEAPDGGSAMAWHAHGARSDPGQWLQVFFHSGGSNNVSGGQYPELDQQIEDQAQIFDYETRVEKIQNIQRWMADNMVVLPADPNVDTISIQHNWVHGPSRYQIYPGHWFRGAETVPLYWKDADRA